MSIVEELCIKFKKQYPQFKHDKLEMNIYCDIMKDKKIIAISNIPHELTEMNMYAVPTSWELK